MLKTFLVLCSLLSMNIGHLLFSSVSAMPIGDPTRAKTEVCVACHSQDGNSTVSIWPKIAGQHEGYIYNQLLEYKKGEQGGRNDPTMYPMLQSYSEQDLADLAAYYAKQTMSAGQTPQSKLELGEKIYRGGNLENGISACIACHGPRGLGNELANYPKLSGQNAEYTISQLNKYKSNERTNDPNAIMRMIVKKMTDKEIEAVSHYVSGLH